MKFDFILLCLSTLALIVENANYSTNYNSSKIDDTGSGDPVSLPIILSSLGEHKSNSPLNQIYNLKKYQLKDTNYTPQLNKLSQLEEEIVYQNQPPSSVFDINRITIEDYQLLQIKEFRIVLINPTTKFRFCVNEIYTDSIQVKRIQQKRLPFCLNSTTKYPFFFKLYITEHKPLIFRTSVYFIISIYDGSELVEQKIWPREIVVKVNHNHLRLGPLEAKNCEKSFTTLVISNPQTHHIKITFDYDLKDSEKKNEEKKVLKEVTIPSQKNFRLNIIPRQTTMTITTRAYDFPDIGLPKLYMPIYCIDLLTIDHFNIGILNSQRSIVEVPIPVSNHANEVIQIHEINVISTTQTTQLLPMQDNVEKVQPQNQHTIICRLLIHMSKQGVQKASITLKILYSLANSPTIYEAKNTYTYRQYRNPLSLGNKRFIDVTKLAQADSDPVLDNIFPMRNNMNLPIMLARVIFDEKKFKLSWLQDKREFIYPGQMRQQFSLQYIGVRKLPISPLKFLVTLEFNGNLFVPIQIIVYDHTLQCLFNNVQQKCSDLPLIDYGYFRNSNAKFKQIVIRNWNPVGKELQIRVKENLIKQYGLNCSVNIFGPFPNYDIMSRQSDNVLYYYLKGNHFIIMNFALSPLWNATSGQTAFSIKTESQSFIKNIKFKVENGTIALIPQVLRIHSAYEKSVEYLNLVSTFSEPYKIKSTTSNVSNLNIFFNNHSQIHENQWVGLALMFTPFTRLNLTQSCCGSDYAISIFITSLYVFEFKRFTYAGIRVTTTTDLQVNSTVIIDNWAPKIIEKTLIQIQLIQTNEPQVYTLPLYNFFSEPMKFKVIIVPRYLYQNAKYYMSTMRKVRKTNEDFMFCASNDIMIKHSFSPQTIKTMFNLEIEPQELPIQVQDNYYMIGSARKSFQDPQNQLSRYFVNRIQKGARMCYKIHAAKYIKELVETQILNDLAEKENNEIFLQFVEKQMEYFNFPSHFLEFDEFYHYLSLNLEDYCGTSSFSLFKFCKHINLIINPHQQAVVNTNQTYNIEIGPALATNNEPYHDFYLTILNNITKYETHHVKLNISQPKIKITNVHLNQNALINKQQFEDQYFEKKDWLEIFGIKDIQSMKEQTFVSEKPKIIPIYVTNSDHYNNSFEGQRTFEVKNVGSVKINITHIGFEAIQHSCSYGGMQIVGEQCQSGFMLAPNEVQKVKVKFSFSDSENMDQILKRKIYFYNGDKYYFSSVLATKFSDKNKKYHSYRKSINSLFLNIISFLFLIFVICNLKKESKEKQKQTTKKMKSKIMNPTSYVELGSMIERKPRKLETISEEQIALVKELQDKKLKEFFNSSGESEIMSKHQVEEEGSQHLLASLKQEKANISVSEESSIDLMDFNNFNRSSEVCVQNHTEQALEEISDPSDPGNDDILTSGWDKLSAGNPQDFDFDDDMKSNYDKMEEKQRLQESKEESKEENKSYFNVFFSQNPLKKGHSDVQHEKKQKKSRR